MLIAGRFLLARRARGHAARRVDIVDNVDNQFLSAGLIAGGRVAGLLVDNVD